MENALEGLKNGCASGLASGCVKTLLQPFDTIKTVQQFSSESLNFFTAGRLLLKRNGVGALYSGLGVSLVGAMPSIGIYFGIYQYCRGKLDQSPRLSPLGSIALSAGIGNFVASFFRVPYEIVKQRLQAGVYPDTATALRIMYADGGVGAFFGRGGIATQLARDVPYAMVTLMVYESLQTAARRRAAARGAAKPSHLETMLIGAIAGGVGTLATNPMDVVKTRMMTAPHLYASAWDAAVVTLRADGARAFARGATPRLLHKVPANGLFFAAYELFRTLLGVRR
ncbi:mitochondrial carrier domain-containing protein [Tribonema minus]|uniref:Mitochondrial carrier domain-containing protein n=1 Tax=Tribonema minus TaxID=303371 RepID=A0A836CPL2_9STRA|nr:mitochondrial carrier domain-containing protein [Tribonema minus]